MFTTNMIVLFEKPINQLDQWKRWRHVNISRKLFELATIQSSPNLESLLVEKYSHFQKQLFAYVLQNRCMCVCVPYRENRTRAVSSACKTNQSGFTYWMSFLASNLMEEISLNIEALSANTQSFISMEKPLKVLNPFKSFKSCVRYIFASLFFRTKRKLL